MFRAWLELARISNLPTVWTNVTAGWLLAGGALNSTHLFWLLLGGSLLYTGGMILNDAADVRFDREHRKERPIPGGRVSLLSAWSVGLGMLAAGWGFAVGCGGSDWRITTALVGCILFYDFYHKPWSGAVWVMGLCRTLLFLMPGASGLPGKTGLGASAGLLSAVALGLYVAGLTLVARMEARKAAVPAFSLVAARALLMMPVIPAMMAVVSSDRWKSLLILADFSPLVPWVVLLVFAGWVAHALRILRRGGPAIGQAVGLMLAGIPLVDALAVSSVQPSLALGFVLMPPLLRFWQRWVAAT